MTKLHLRNDFRFRDESTIPALSRNMDEDRSVAHRDIRDAAIDRPDRHPITVVVSIPTHCMTDQEKDR